MHRASTTMDEKQNQQSKPEQANVDVAIALIGVAICICMIFGVLWFRIRRRNHTKMNETMSGLEGKKVELIDDTDNEKVGITMEENVVTITSE